MKKCRFCKKTKPEASFKRKAHTFPNFMGNKELLSLDECDECNSFFGNTIERDAAEFFLPHRALFGIEGKGGKKQFRTHDRALSFGHSLVNGKQCLVIIAHTEEANKYIIENQNGLKISTPSRPYVPVAVEFLC